MFTDTIPNVGTCVIAQTGAGGLEVLVALNPRQVTTSQISGTTHQVRDPGVEGGQNDLGQFTRSLSGIGGGVDGKGRLPTSREFTRDTTGEFGVFIGVFLAISSQEVVPLGLEVSTTGGNIPVGLVGFFGDVERLVGGEIELGLQRDDIVSLESYSRRQ